MSADRSDILAKIRKLLALAESPNEHEARLAMAKAAELMEQHAIEMADVAEVDSEWVNEEGGTIVHRTMPYAWHWIGPVLNDFFFVCCFETFVPLRVEGKRTTCRSFRIFGRRDQVAIAKHVFAYLEQTSQRLWEEYASRTRGRSMSRKRSYIQGVFCGLYQQMDRERVRRRAVHPADSTAVACCKGESDAAFKAWQERHNGPMRKKAPPKAADDAAAFQAGQQDGTRIKIDPAIDVETDPRRQRSPAQITNLPQHKRPTVT